jgi:hypothetical protein
MALNDGMDLRPASEVESMSSAQAGQKLAEMKVEFDRANAPAPPAALPPGSSAMTPAQAAQRLAQLQSDPRWTEKLLAGSGAQQREFAELSALAMNDDSGDTQADNLIEVVDSISDKNALSRAAYAALFDGLRANGLPAESEQYIRDLDSGKRVDRPTSGDRIAFEQARARLLNSPEYVRKCLSGDIRANNLRTALDRVIAIAADDGQPLTEYGQHVLSELGLR